MTDGQNSNTLSDRYRFVHFAPTADILLPAFQFPPCSPTARWYVWTLMYHTIDVQRITSGWDHTQVGFAECPAQHRDSINDFQQSSSTSKPVEWRARRPAMLTMHDTSVGLPQYTSHGTSFTKIVPRHESSASSGVLLGVEVCFTPASR